MNQIKTVQLNVQMNRPTFYTYSGFSTVKYAISCLYWVWF